MLYAEAAGPMPRAQKERSEARSMNACELSLVPCEDQDGRRVEAALRAVPEPVGGPDFVRPGTCSCAFSGNSPGCRQSRRSCRQEESARAVR